MNRFIRLLMVVAATGILAGCDDIFEKDISVEEPVVFTPLEGQPVNQGAALFWWDYMNGADYYQVQIARPGFELIDKLAADTILENNKLVLNLEAGTYVWKIRACNSAYCTPFFQRALVITGR
jgi:hypothetical protein